MLSFCSFSFQKSEMRKDGKSDSEELASNANFLEFFYSQSRKARKSRSWNSEVTKLEPRSLTDIKILSVVVSRNRYVRVSIVESE